MKISVFSMEWLFFCVFMLYLRFSSDMAVELTTFSFSLLDLLLLCVTQQMVSLFWQVDCQNLSVYIMSRNRFL